MVVQQSQDRSYGLIQIWHGEGTRGYKGFGWQSLSTMQHTVPEGKGLHNRHGPPAESQSQKHNEDAM
jgi:hypothetical protein